MMKIYLFIYLNFKCYFEMDWYYLFIYFIYLFIYQLLSKVWSLSNE